MRTHFANEAGEINLMDFEVELNRIISAFIATQDATERANLMKEYQQVYTSNVYGVGLTAYPGALIINKRFSNIPPGAPIFMYNWAEDNIIRERVWVSEDQQNGLELYPDSLPAAPGTAGFVTAG
jgi:peptide/nickel transport system substrate-binding protein